MLEALCAFERLSEVEEEAFGGMLGRMRRGGLTTLSAPQHKWVEDRYFFYELDADAPAENLVSSGKVQRTDVVLPYEKLHRPKKPPGHQ